MRRPGLHTRDSNVFHAVYYHNLLQELALTEAQSDSAHAPPLPAGPQGREGPSVAVRGQCAALARGGRAAVPADSAQGQDQHGAQQRLVRAADQLRRGPGTWHWHAALLPALHVQAGADAQPVTWQAAAARQMGTPGGQRVFCTHVLRVAAKAPSVKARQALACKARLACVRQTL